MSPTRSLVFGFAALLALAAAPSYASPPDPLVDVNGLPVAAPAEPGSPLVTAPVEVHEVDVFGPLEQLVAARHARIVRLEARAAEIERVLGELAADEVTPAPAEIDCNKACASVCNGIVFDVSDEPRGPGDGDCNNGNDCDRSSTPAEVLARSRRDHADAPHVIALRAAAGVAGLPLQLGEACPWASDARAGALLQRRLQS